MIRRAARALLVAGLAAALSACTLDLDVRVDVHADGSGSVAVTAEVDAAALARIGGDLADAVDVGGLRAEGWAVDGPSALPGGGSTVTVRQGFRDPEEAAEVFAELAGDERRSPFRDLAVEVDRSAFRTEWRFAGTVDLTGGLAVPGVRPQADGEALPDDVEQLEARLGTSLDRLLRLRVGVRLPGDVEANATTEADNGAVWQVRFGDGPVELDATGTRTRTSSYLLVGAGLVLLLVGAIALLIRLAARTTAPDRSDPRTG